MRRFPARRTIRASTLRPSHAVGACPELRSLVQPREITWSRAMNGSWEQTSKARWKVTGSGCEAATRRRMAGMSMVPSGVSAPTTIPATPADLQNPMSEMICCNAASSYTKLSAWGRTRTLTGIESFETTSLIRSRGGVRPPTARSTHSSMRPAPPASAARALSISVQHDSMNRRDSR